MNVLAGQRAFKPRHLGRLNYGGVNAELVPQFVLPLLAQMRRTQNSDALGGASVQQFARHQAGFDGFSHAHVVCDEHADGVHFQGHRQGDVLVWARRKGYSADGSEWACARPEVQAKGVAEQTCARKIAGAFGGRLGIRRRAYCVRLYARVYADPVIFGAVRRAQQRQLFLIRRHNHPSCAHGKPQANPAKCGNYRWRQSIEHLALKLAADAWRRRID